MVGGDEEVERGVLIERITLHAFVVMPQLLQ
jgi:hypothetical protein